MTESQSQTSKPQVATGLPAFDADYSPNNSVNKKVARARDLRFDSQKGFYVDSGGCLVLDRFGQPL